jgi:hypothetical protein
MRRDANSGTSWRLVQPMVEDRKSPTTSKGLKQGGPTPQLELPHHLPHLINKVGWWGESKAPYGDDVEIQPREVVPWSLESSLTSTPPVGTEASRRSSTVGIHIGPMLGPRWPIGAGECRVPTSRLVVASSFPTTPPAFRDRKVVGKNREVYISGQF